MKLYRGARQLQALVRLRTKSHGSGPSLSGRSTSTRRHFPGADTVMPNGPMLGAGQPNRVPYTTGPSLGSALRLEPNRPDGCRLLTKELTTLVFTQELVCGGMRSLTNRG